LNIILFKTFIVPKLTEEKEVSINKGILIHTKMNAKSVPKYRDGYKDANN
jgi:hypothetical protein